MSGDSPQAPSYEPFAVRPLFPFAVRDVLPGVPLKCVTRRLVEDLWRSDKKLLPYSAEEFLNFRYFTSTKYESESNLESEAILTVSGRAALRREEGLAAIHVELPPTVAIPRVRAMAG